jgi:hypothetical protein
MTQLSSAVALGVRYANSLAKTVGHGITPIFNALLNTDSYLSGTDLFDIPDCRDIVVSNLLAAAEITLDQHTPPAGFVTGAYDLMLFHNFRINSTGQSSEPLSFSFDDASWLVFYQIGAAQCLRDLVKNEYIQAAKFLGSGSGALVAAYLAAGVDLEILFEQLKYAAGLASNSFIGPFSLSSSLKSILGDVTWPEMKKLGNRLRISMTEVPSITSVASLVVGRDLNLTNVIASDFLDSNVSLTNIRNSTTVFSLHAIVQSSSNSQSESREECSWLVKSRKPCRS